MTFRRLYAWLIQRHPERFRQEFGEQMLSIHKGKTFSGSCGPLARSGYPVWLRVSLNGNFAGPWVKSPVIVPPSSASVPLKVGLPGTPVIENETDAPSTVMFVSGNAFAPCIGISTVPDQLRSSFC